MSDIFGGRILWLGEIQRFPTALLTLAVPR